MTLPQLYLIVVLVIPLTLIFMNRLREDVAALSMAVALGVAQYLGMAILGPAHSPDAATKALTGFGTPEVLTLLSLFIITACLDKYGATAWIARQLLAIGGQSERRLITLFASVAAFLSLFMNTLAAGALLVPSALNASRRTGIKPSKLLIPIAYGTMLGGAATYLTTANLLVSALLPLADPPQPTLSILAFTPTGGLVAIAGLLFLGIFGKYILPDREPPAMAMAATGDELTSTYKLQERLWEAKVTPSSSVANHSLSQTRIGETLGMSIVVIRRYNQILPVRVADQMINVGDTLLMVGREERALQLKQAGLDVSPPQSNTRITPQNVIFVEVIVPPRSTVEGKTLSDLAFRSKYRFTAIALWRSNWSYRTDVAKMSLLPGDTLLLMGLQEDLKSLQAQRDFIVLETSSQEQNTNMAKIGLTLAISIGALIAMFIGMPIELAALTAATLVLLAGLMSPEEAYTAIKWRAIFLIAGTISVSVAMVQTGLAQSIGNTVVHLVEPFGPLGLLAGAYFLSAALTQVMGGQISPLVVGPITISAAIRLGINPQAIAVVTAIAGSVSFITPLSHPVNILMIAPANYKFSDFVKSGWLLTIVCFIALMIAVPLFWDL